MVIYHNVSMGIFGSRAKFHQNLTEHSGAKKKIPQWGDYTHIAPRKSCIKFKNLGKRVVK